MKKGGFSLTEILLSVLIIGVVSAITIPTVAKNYKLRTYAKKLAVVKADVETALSSMIATEGVNDLSETIFGRSNILDQYFKVEEVGSINDFYNNNPGFAFPFNFISGGTFAVADTGSFRLKNGVFLIYESGFVERDNISSIGKMYIDVNGSSTPNTIGRDIFVFRVGNDGILYPAGGRTYSILDTGEDNRLWTTDNSNLFGCNDNAMGLGCTARLIENGYNVDF